MARTSMMSLKIAAEEMEGRDASRPKKEAETRDQRVADKRSFRLFSRGEIISWADMVTGMCCRLMQVGE